MFTNVDKLMQSGCETEKSEKLCRARGGESCAFDGAMIVLQPIADAAHIVHGPISCCGNSWEGRGTLSSKGELHKWGFTTDMTELDIVYGSEEKLYRAIIKTNETVHPKAIFVHATCVSGLIGENIEAVCKRAENEIAIRVIPVNAPGFVGPKNLGNRIAGEVLMDHVIGTGEVKDKTEYDVNLIGEYNIAGDLWLIEPVLKKAGIRVLSRITGDSTFEEITYAHRARLNVMVCSRALINVAKEMERLYGIPYTEVSFFGKTEMSKALRAIGENFGKQNPVSNIADRIEEVIAEEELRLEERLAPYRHLSGKKAVLYTGGVKSWSFISALLDLGIEIVAVGTKKSTFEDEEKMKAILGPDAPLVEDVTPKNLLRLLRENNADMLVAGGRNKYLGVKEGYPFIDVNQERHRPYAGYDGLVNIADDLSNAIKFYRKGRDYRAGAHHDAPAVNAEVKKLTSDVMINPLKHSQAIGAALAFQGIHRAVPIIHGAQGCNFLGKVLLTGHFREPIAMVSSKLFVENVVMGSEENIIKTVESLIEKNSPDIIGILTTGLSEVKGDDVGGALKMIGEKGKTAMVHVSTPDYAGGLETGYARAVEAIVAVIIKEGKTHLKTGQVNVLAGPHLTPADFTELREMIESFGLRPIMIPDLAALDGSRKGLSALALGGTTFDDLKDAANSEFNIVIGASMELPAIKMKEKFGIEYRVFESIAGVGATDLFMEALSMLSGRPMLARYERKRSILVDGMRDAHFYYSGKRATLALDPDLSIALSRVLDEMGVEVVQAVIPHSAPSAAYIVAEEVIVGDLQSVGDGMDILISNSHAQETAKRLKVPLYQAGFPVYKILGITAKVTIGYAGTLNAINEIGNLLITAH